MPGGLFQRKQASDAAGTPRVREAAVAGAFYSMLADDLRSEIESCFTHRLGRGDVPQLNPKWKRTIRGAVAPHAGYMYSGPTATHVYGALAEDGFPPTFVIIGPNHRGIGGPVAFCPEAFETPLGVVSIESQLGDKIVAASDGLVTVDAESQAREHSIEVQLPFLQYFSKDFSFVPLAMAHQDYDTAVALGTAVAEAIEGKDVVVIASTDFSHYIPKKEATRRDKYALDAIVARDPKRLWDTLHVPGAIAKGLVTRDEAAALYRKEDGGSVHSFEKWQWITMCGYGAVMATLTALNLLGAKDAKALHYSTSGDVSAMDEVVGYGAVLLS